MTFWEQFSRVLFLSDVQSIIITDNNDIREIMGLSCIRLELRLRRLKWLRDILDNPRENVQLRAAVAGNLQLPGEILTKPYLPWLNIIRADLIWYLRETMRSMDWRDHERCREGIHTLNLWDQQGQLGKILSPDLMVWFKHITTDLHDLRHYKDISEPRESQMPQGESRCEHVNMDGSVCQFQGPPALMGLHRYYDHGMCNPIKATVVNNECPGCGTIFASVKSAKEHANRSWKLGRCPNHRVSRPYSFNLIREPIDSVICCKICKTEVQGNDEIMAHMRNHFHAIITEARASQGTDIRALLNQSGRPN